MPIESVTFEELALWNAVGDVDPDDLTAPEVELAVDECPERGEQSPIKQAASCAFLSAAVGGTHAVSRSCCRLCRYSGGDGFANAYLANLALGLAHMRTFINDPDMLKFDGPAQLHACTQTVKTGAGAVTANRFVITMSRREVVTPEEALAIITELELAT